MGASHAIKVGVQARALNDDSLRQFLGGQSVAAVCHATFSFL
jgi:hypothetical protein